MLRRFRFASIYKLLGRIMPRQLLTYLFFALTAVCFGQKEKSYQKNDMISLELKVTLKDDITKIKLPPDCGIFEVNSLTLNYNVKKVIKGKYKAKTILINHRCPKHLIDNKQIANDTIYTYKLRQKITQSDTKTKPEETEYEVIE